jgi:hypothetical protein
LFIEYSEVFDQHLSTAYTSLKVIQTYLDLLMQEHLESLRENKKGINIFFKLKNIIHQNGKGKTVSENY